MNEHMTYERNGIGKFVDGTDFLHLQDLKSDLNELFIYNPSKEEAVVLKTTVYQYFFDNKFDTTKIGASQVGLGGPL
jgi:hypothetical protein